MKKYILFTGVLSLFITIVFGQNNVGIGTDNPHTSAILDVSSNDKGLLIPRMTQASRNAIINPAEGLMVFQNDGKKGFYHYQDNAWKAVSSEGLPSSAIVLSETMDNPALKSGGFSLHSACQLTTGQIEIPQSSSWSSTFVYPRNVSNSSLVWTGSEMVAYGGLSQVDYNNGGYPLQNSTYARKYNPSTGEYQEVQLSSVGTNRFNHTSIFTGKKIITWGGCYLSAYSSLLTYVLNSGSIVPVEKPFEVDNTIYPYDLPAISTTNAPSARQKHTAVWTGTEMIVWGGTNEYNNVNYNTGGKYNPITNTWTTVSATNAPSARRGHKAIWTGTEMIIWGGTNGTTVFNDGAKYNPTTDTWTLISATNAPSSRYNHSLVWTGTEMIAWGGYNGSSVLNNGAKYIPSTNTWTAMNNTNAPAARQEHVGVWSGTSLVVWGGNTSGGMSPTNTGANYDPSTDTWESLPTTGAPPAAVNALGAWANGKLIVMGGQTSSSTIANSYYIYSLFVKGIPTVSNASVATNYYLFKKN